MDITDNAATLAYTMHHETEDFEYYYSKQDLHPIITERLPKGGKWYIDIFMQKPKMVYNYQILTINFYKEITH